MPVSSTQPGHLCCVRCSYEWMPRKEQLPKRCPNCRSVKWNEANLRVTCMRCEHTWNSHDGNPKRCPNCGSHQWNVPPRSFTCKRCSKTWESKGNKIPKRCPSCFSKRWNIDRDMETITNNDPNDSSEDEESIRKLYRKGLGCVDISIELGLPYGLVRAVIIKDNPGTVPRV